MQQVLQCIIDKRLTDTDDLNQDVQIALVLYRYLKAELSLGEAAELLGQDPESTLDWLASLGIPTARPMNTTQEIISAANA